MKLLEINRYQKEFKKPYIRNQNLIDQYVGQENLYIHFSDFPKLGINPINTFETPLGFYSYSLKSVKKISSFGTERNFMIIFRAKNPNKLLNSETYNEENLENDLNKLKNIFKDDFIVKLYHEDSKRKAKVLIPAGKLWYVTMKLSNENTTKWNAIWRKLGYDGFTDEDSCAGIIHSSEFCQTVFWDTTKLEIVDIIDRRLDYEVVKPNYKNYNINPYYASKIFSDEKGNYILMKNLKGREPYEYKEYNKQLLKKVDKESNQIIIGNSKANSYLIKLKQRIIPKDYSYHNINWEYLKKNKDKLTDNQLEYIFSTSTISPLPKDTFLQLVNMFYNKVNWNSIMTSFDFINDKKTIQFVNYIIDNYPKAFASLIQPSIPNIMLKINKLFKLLQPTQMLKLLNHLGTFNEARLTVLMPYYSVLLNNYREFLTYEQRFAIVDLLRGYEAPPEMMDLI